MKCFVVSNCTHAPIREYLAATGIFHQVDSKPLFQISQDKIDEEFEHIKSYDLVLSAAHYGDWGPFEIEAIKSQLGDRVQIFTTPFFTGLHPDLIHIDVKGQRVNSPTGAYHSGFVLWGFLTGTPIANLVEMYRNGAMPAELGLEGEWEASMKILRQRDQAVDIPIADLVENSCRNGQAMYTFNHPTMTILGAIAQRFAKTVVKGQDLPPISAQCVFNSLATDVMFPVSPFVLKTNNLNYRTLHTFKCGLETGRRGEYLTFREFATECYQQYSQFDRDQIVTTTRNGCSDYINSLLGK